VAKVSRDLQLLLAMAFPVPFKINTLFISPSLASEMDLSRKAIITLRSPSSGATPQTWPPPTVTWFQRTWHITHSTHAPSRYHGRKNARVGLRLANDDETCYAVELSHQDAQTLSVESTTSTLASLDLSAKDRTASRFKLSHSSRAEQWEVLAWGKEGQLEEWMTEEINGMISDPSGEWRPDWRNSYVVVLIRKVDEHAGPQEQRECVVEVWDHNGGDRPLSEETVGKIKDALKAAGIEGELHPVVVDGGRTEDDERQRMAAEGPVCTDIVPDEEEPRARWCCF
jgi:hypothetical protein